MEGRQRYDMNAENSSPLNRNNRATGTTANTPTTPYKAPKPSSRQVGNTPSHDRYIPTRANINMDVLKHSFASPGIPIFVFSICKTAHWDCLCIHTIQLSSVWTN